MSEIRMRVELKAHPGHEEEVEQIFRDLVASVRGTEPDTLGYDYHRSPTPGSYVVHEHYASSEAAIAHTKALDLNRATKLLEITDGSPIEVYGDPTPECLTMLGGFGLEVRIYPPVITLRG
jgi:quinol monooxygenase YgiN